MANWSPPLSAREAQDGFVYGGLTAEAGLMSWVRDFVWPDNVGPFEEMMRVAEFGAMFVTDGIANTILWVASLFGLGLQDLGRKMDDIIGVHSLKDLEGKDPTGIVAQLLDMTPDQLARTQAGAGIAQTSSSDLDNLIVKSGMLHSFAAGKNPSTWRLHIDKQRLEHEKDLIQQGHSPQLAKQMAEKAFPYPGFVSNTIEGLVNPSDTDPNNVGRNVFVSAWKKIVSPGVKNKVIGVLLVVVSWVISAGTEMLMHPLDGAWKAAKAAGKMTTENFGRDVLANPMGVYSRTGKPSAAQQQVDQNRAAVFPKEPKSFQEKASVLVDSIMAEGLT